MEDGSILYPRVTLKDGEHLMEAKGGRDKWNMRQYVRLVAEGKDIWIPNYVLLVALGFVPDMLGVDCDMNCKACNKHFDPMPMFEDYNQAAGCSATLYLYGGSYYILAHYGSMYDMQRYALKTDKYEVGEICDDCIKNYIETGHAHLIEDGVW